MEGETQALLSEYCLQSVTTGSPTCQSTASTYGTTASDALRRSILPDTTDLSISESIPGPTTTDELSPRPKMVRPTTLGAAVPIVAKPSPTQSRDKGKGTAVSGSRVQIRPALRRAHTTSDFSRMPTLLTRLKRNLSSGLGLPFAFTIPPRPTYWNDDKHHGALQQAWRASQSFAGLIWSERLYAKTIDAMLQRFPELAAGQCELRPEWVEYVVWRAQAADMAASPVYRYV